MANFIQNFLKPKGPTGNRVVYANDTLKNAHYANNEVTNTKYTLLNFVPKNLMEQFSRAMNRYFFIIACLQLVAIITPVNPLTTWLPLAVIFGVTAVKEAVDDYGRRNADKAANGRIYTVVREGKKVDIASRDIAVGDIVYLRENDEVPADCVVIATSDANGNAYIQTTNLDGESNLKVRSALSNTKGLTTDEDIGNFKGVIECAQPNEHIYVFDSQLRMENDSETVLPLSASQLLLQATHLRNTDWMYGLVVYTGNETKFGKNKKTPPTKYTVTDGFINNVSASIFAFQLLLVFIFGIVGDTFTDANTRTWDYMLYAGNPYPGYFQLIIPARFLLLNSTMIPISLKLTIDLCKLFYAKFIDADLHLYDAESDTPAKSNSTALSEDLGQVKYVLTDKTGTLTENKMVLKVAVIGEKVYGTTPGHSDDSGSSGTSLTSPFNENSNVAESTPLPPTLATAAKNGTLADVELYNAAERGDSLTVEFLRCLALNNDVVPAPPSREHLPEDADPSTAPRVYKASSPDEEALVKSAAAYNASLWERNGDIVNIDIHGKREQYTQLVAFEFTSDRKRMSVLVRNSNGKLRLYIKGADDMIMARVAAGNEGVIHRLQERVNTYAAAGLRTLVYGYRDISENEYLEWKAKYDQAAAAMVDRDEEKEKTYALMEKDILLLGATAIEDKLQDGVPETISLLKQAGISFWMLTGDKFSTARTIAETSALKPANTELVEIEGEDAETVRTAVVGAYNRLKDVGHDLRYEPVPTFWETIKDTVSNLKYTPHIPPRPYTAISTSLKSTNSFSDSDDVVKGNPMRAIATSDVVIETNELNKLNEKRPYTIIVRGSTLGIALTTCKEEFAALCCGADSVICCRVTPKQKGQLVHLVKDAGHLTLAIGDGGNDVSMIQEAAVGIGIRGKEGLQAARAADYQVKYFRALQRLLLIHGRYSYYRTAVVAQYSFYKSFLFCVMQIGYGFFSGFAGVSLFNSLCVAAYNAVLFVPIVFFLVDRDITQKTALTQPQAYLMCSEGSMMTFRTMMSWMIRGLWQAIVTLLFGIYANTLTKSSDYESLGLLIFMAYMFTQDFTMLFSLRRVTWYNTVSIFGMHVISFGIGLATNNAWGMRSFIDYGSFTNTLKDPSFWLTCLLITVATVLPVQSKIWWDFAFVDNFENRLNYVDRVIESQEVQLRKEHDRKSKDTDPLLSSHHSRLGSRAGKTTTISGDVAGFDKAENDTFEKTEIDSTPITEKTVSETTTNVSDQPQL